MRSSLYPRLAMQSIRNNRRFYIPYILALLGDVAAIYIMSALCRDPGVKNMTPGRPNGYMYVSVFMNIGQVIAFLFSAIFVLYINGFLMKQRKKELGLYNILGMGKGHIAVVLTIETVYISVLGIGGGIVTGLIFHKLVSLILHQMLGMPVPLGFYISWDGMAWTAGLFLLLLAVTLLVNLNKVRVSKPIELLRGGNVGEREPKTKWFMTLLGIVTLGAGYYIAVTTRTGVDAIVTYFLAVGLVIIGTYCLFTAVSIFILKALRKNKKFYYQTGHFIGVSGMLYRMKQNAVGLASICILSTMVLVTVSTTIAMNIGLENSLNEMYPYDIEFLQDLENQPGDPMDRLREVEAAANASGGFTDSRYYTRYWVYCGVRGSEISLNLDQNCLRTELEVVTAEDYSRLTGKNVILAPDEVLACSKGPADFPSDFTVSANFGEAGLSFHVREEITEVIRHATNKLLGSEESSLFLVVADRETAEALMDLDTSRSARQFRVQMNLAGEDYEEKLAQTERLVFELSKRDGGVSFTSKQDNAQEFYAMYGGFLFLGVFLGLLFLLATVLIIYYKQISEGCEDQRRFLILRQVGMSEKEINASIHSQILLVFFLPLGAAALHVFMAFPMLSRMLELFNLHDGKLFVLCTAGTLAVFCLIYALVFAWTARAYGKIVGGTN